MKSATQEFRKQDQNIMPRKKKYLDSAFVVGCSFNKMQHQWNKINRDK